MDNDIEINQIQPIVQKFMTALANKPEDQSLENLMVEVMSEELPDKSLLEIQAFCQEILKETTTFNENHESLNSYSKSGGNKNQWLFRKISDKISEKIAVLKKGSTGADKLAEQEIQESVKQQLERQTEAINSTNNLIRKWLKSTKTIEGLVKSVHLEVRANLKTLIAAAETKATTASIQEAAYSLGKNVAWLGIGSAIVGTAFYLVQQKTSHQDIKKEEAIEIALNTGSDTGIKVATAAAIKVSLERGMIPLLAKSTPAGLITNIACVGIENLKILAKFSKHEIKGTDAMDKIAKTSLTMFYGLGWGTEGAALGASLFSFFPIIGTIVGSIFGGMVGYIAGSVYGEGLHAAAKELIGKAKVYADITWNSLCVRRQEMIRQSVSMIQYQNIKK